MTRLFVSSEIGSGSVENNGSLTHKTDLSPLFWSCRNDLGGMVGLGGDGSEWRGGGRGPLVPEGKNPPNKILRTVNDHA